MIPKSMRWKKILEFKKVYSGVKRATSDGQRLVLPHTTFKPYR